MGLILTRRVKEGLTIEIAGEQCRVQVLHVNGDQVKLRFQGDRDKVRVWRDDVKTPMRHKATVPDATVAGFEAYKAGKTMEDNPYDRKADSLLHDMWKWGFVMRQKKE